MNEELDLRVLKGIIQDKVNALTFSYRYDHTLFDDDIRNFAKLVLDYTKHFRAPPTKRTLSERHAGNAHIIGVISNAWQEIDDVEYDSKEFSFDVLELKKRFQTRAVDEIRVKASQEDPEESKDPEQYFNNLSLALSRITSLDLERTHTQLPVGDYIEDFKDSYEAKKLSPSDTVKVKTGYTLIDSVCGGLAPGELIMIGGETNSGKSMFLNNIAKQIWMQGNAVDTKVGQYSSGYNILYFSLEMPYRDCFIRFLASLANVPQRAISEAELSPEDEKKVNKAYEFIKNYQESGYYFDIVDVPRNLTIEEVELRFHDAMLRYRPDVVIVDYMGLMHSTALAKEQDWLKMGGIAASLHEFARAYDCVVITAAQLTDLKRNAGGSKDEARRVGVHRWGRSSLIMHNVNLGIQIETRPNERSFPDLKIHIVKNRNGPLGQGNLVKNFANASLVDVPYDQRDIPGDVSSDIPNLIKAIQAAKNKEQENGD